MIMSLCNKSVHSFLGLTNTTTLMDDNSNNDKQGGLGLSPAPTVPLFTFPSVFSKKDPGGIGFIDDMGGGVDGLMSCTESLGFESSDERIDHQIDEIMDARSLQYNDNNKAIRRKDKDRHRHQEVKKFPPPLSSFNRNGQPSLFLRSVRSDGRLELTEVRVDRPEILRASREDGRLRLHLIREDEDEQDEEDEEEEEEETLEGEEEAKETLEEEEEEEERVGEWKLEGFRRCNEMNGHHDYHHHHHHEQHVWSQQCVPTR